jgi:hypothetical protein
MNWVPFDDRLLYFSWTTGSFDLIFNKNCVVMQGPRYGELVLWNRDAAHRLDIVGFSRAHLILEAQSQLLKVLREIVEVLVEGFPDDKMTLKSSLVSTTTVQKRTGIFNFTSSSMSSPYTSCPIFDLGNLRAIAKTRLDMSVDHVWQLQTDPAYMCRYLQVFWEGEISKLPKDQAYAIATIDIDYDVWTTRHWSWIVSEMEELAALKTKFQDSIFPGHPLPLSYGRKLAALEILLLELVDCQSRHIQCVIPPRPGFRHLYDFDFSQDGVVCL